MRIGKAEQSSVQPGLRLGLNLGYVLEVQRTSSRIGLQLNQTGKATSTLPWESVKGAIGEGPGWQTISASAEPFGQGWPAPRMATTADLAAITTNYAESSTRALHVGFDTLEIHAARGYLLRSFLYSSDKPSRHR